jgi:hypothetical protein
MEEEIINYLVVRNLCNKDFEPFNAQRSRPAWILAKTQYLKLSESDKDLIRRRINDAKNSNY